MKTPLRLPKSRRRGLLALVFLVSLFTVWRVAPMLFGSGSEVLLSPSEADSLARFQESAAQGKGKSTPPAGELFPFDPNHADSLTLLRLGLRPWQVGNMMKYRARGGVWRSPDDLRRLYGLTEEQYARLRPYVRIAPADRRAEYSESGGHRYGTPLPERPEYEPVEKYPEGTLLPLNVADTTELCRIPGIGKYYARKIVRYRDRLGGFVSVSQLAEIDGLPAGVQRWFTLEGGGSLRRIRINHADFGTLIKHPYLDFDQTKAIVRHIRTYGALRGWDDLRLYACFKDSDFCRLAPYFSFK